MENCIISPFMIYLLGVSISLKIIIAIIIAICTVIALLSLNDTDKLVSKVGFIIVLILSLLFAIIPSENTLKNMIISRTITYENISLDNNVIQKNIDYLLNKIDEINNK